MVNAKELQDIISAKELEHISNKSISEQLRNRAEGGGFYFVTGFLPEETIKCLKANGYKLEEYRSSTNELAWTISWYKEDN